MLQPLLDSTEFTERTVSRTPLGRIGQPDDVADVIMFLLSNQSRFVTGTSLIVDGGLTSIGGI